MKMWVKVLCLLLFSAMLLSGCTLFQQPQQQPPSNQTQNQTQNQTSNQTLTPAESACLASGGVVIPEMCCGSAGNFPNTCPIGACGCSPENSHEVEVCECGEGKCWDSGRSRCVAVSQPPQNVSQNQSNSTFGADRIYRLDSVKSYTYRLTLASSNGQPAIVVNITTTVSSDTLNGTDAWLQQSYFSIQGTEVTGKVWWEKATYKCLKATSLTNYGGQQFEQSSRCSDPQLVYVGSESVTVPAGTFNADEYSWQGTTYWAASSIPVPVKTSSNNGAQVMELVSYN